MLRRCIYSLLKSSFSLRSKSKILFSSLIAATCLFFFSYYNTNTNSNEFNKQKETHRHFYRIKEKKTSSQSYLSSLVTNHLHTSNNTKMRQNETLIKWRHLTVYDGGGFGSTHTGSLKCSSSASQIEIKSSRDAILTANFSFFHMNAPKSSLLINNNNNNDSSRIENHYTMVFTMESEVHSFGGDTWSNADFRMWYNLDESFPEPATYFDVRIHLSDLMAPQRVVFDEKESEASIVWIVSNCNAFNGREVFMRELMARINVHSYGNCLKNKHTHTMEHMKGNVALFSRYKFVIAIENSNCQDYVTEKLVHAVASGSIPIVAGIGDAPNYLKFMPKNSYINIYDFASIDSLVSHLKFVSSNQTEYEKYIWFKKMKTSNQTLVYSNNNNNNNNKNNETELSEFVKESRLYFQYIGAHVDQNLTFFNELIRKESSENKLCKIARYLMQSNASVVRKEIEKKRADRPYAKQVCLPRRHIVKHFGIKPQNDEQNEYKYK